MWFYTLFESPTTCYQVNIKWHCILHHRCARFSSFGQIRPQRAHSVCVRNILLSVYLWQSCRPDVVLLFICVECTFLVSESELPYAMSMPSRRTNMNHDGDHCHLNWKTWQIGKKNLVTIVCIRHRSKQGFSYSRTITRIQDAGAMQELTPRGSGSTLKSS